MMPRGSGYAGGKRGGKRAPMGGMLAAREKVKVEGSPGTTPLVG